MPTGYIDPIIVTGDMLAAISGNPVLTGNQGDANFALSLPGTAALGTSSDLYRLVWVQNVNGSATSFSNGQGWRIEAYDPSKDNDGDAATGNGGWQVVPGMNNLNAQGDMYQGLADGDEYIILTGGSKKVLFDINGGLPSTPTTLVYPGSGQNGDPAQGNNNGKLEFEDAYNALTPACFLPGTRIATPSGPRTIESLRPGEMILTLDHGPRPLRMLLTRTISLDEAGPAASPVLIPAGSLAPGLPERPLACSPQHRLLETSAGQNLLAAKALLGSSGVHSAPTSGRVTYLNVVMDRHEIIFAEGVAVESFYPGPVALEGLSPLQKLRLSAILPAQPAPARPFGKTGQWARRLAVNPGQFHPLGMAATA
ncbi:Hint domain-containing protein [Vannielia litorea]|uniref:Hint domain-containing protein n=1 Tax=Vannielia litorea TaxID=1217970 RepID=UPI001C96A96C|nr:Hint domain-containing protein [Vannielia litorea]MBY6155241.1 Hint domain-containing protein [Vannielia litorea]